MQTSLSLSGPWTLAPDAEARGLIEQWFKRFPSEGTLEQHLPAAWQHVIPDHGPDVVWYRRCEPLDCPLAPGERLWLRFESVATDIRAWVNGVEVGRHTGDWVAFGFEITQAAAEAGSIDIVLRVDRVRPGPVRQVNGHPQQGGHITKGFHDVLSMQHAGIWQEVRLERTRGLCVASEGLWTAADVRTGEVRVEVELEPGHSGGRLDVEIVDANAAVVAQGSVEIERGYHSRAVTLRVPEHRAWSPDDPVLYSARVLLTEGGNISQSTTRRFGFRRVEVSKDGRHILLNGRAIFVSGILDWGHEPEHIAPAPSPDEVRARFGTLREMGFNCVCVCMWYPPRSFYEVADEMGMLIWQEHPVWKSDMSDPRVEDYKQQFAGFFRRDRNHPCVVIVSGSCEHEAFNPRLAAWWWEQAKHLLPDRLVQIQTAFLDWTDLSRTDLYDEHTYEGSGRWAAYLEDLDEALARREPKPLVMGESVMYVSWPDVERYDRLGAGLWWVPPALDSVRAINASVAAMDGPDACAHLRRVGLRYSLAGRKFQTELVRMYPRNAGLVANGLRDVPVCPCGFMDDFNEWKFSPEQVRCWTGDVVVLLRTPEHRRGFVAGSSMAMQIGVSNYGPVDLEGPIEWRIDDEPVRSTACEGVIRQGQVRFEPLDTGWLASRTTDRPVPVRLSGRLHSIENQWTIWLLPTRRPFPPGTAQLAGRPFAPEETELDFEEKKYSSGWGLANHSWRPRLPDPGILVPDAQPWDGTGRPESSVRVLVTHRLSPEVLAWLAQGGRVLHMPSKVKDGLPTKFITGFGLVPWIRSAGPLARFGRDWIEGLLDHDLMRRWTRAVPVGELAIAEALEPYVRMLYTHDMARSVPVYDFLSAARVGQGVLAISCADHHDDAGRVLLDEILAWLAGEEGMPERELDMAMLKSLIER